MQADWSAAAAAYVQSVVEWHVVQVRTGKERPTASQTSWPCSTGENRYKERPTASQTSWTCSTGENR